MIETLVLKFGGSSVATVEKIQKVASRIANFRESGYDVAVVVSARGDTTDELIEFARSVAPDYLDLREMDQLLATGEQQSVALLALALGQLGVTARSLTGPQWGLKAKGTHGMGLIEQVDSRPVRQAFTEGAVVVAAGFQGLDQKGDFITLGRGGSDLSAIALAASLDAKACSIYTDVTGVFSADPRKVSGAVKLDRISDHLCLEMTSAGAKVLQSRCVELATRYSVPLYVAHSVSEETGTWIMKSVHEGASVVAVVDQAGWAQVEVENCDVQRLLEFLNGVTEEGLVPVEYSRNERGLDLWFMADFFPRLAQVAQRWQLKLSAPLTPFTKLTVVGEGLGNHGEYLALIPKILMEHHIFPLRYQAYGNSLALWVPQEVGEKGLQLLHEKLIEHPVESVIRPCASL